jgi:hypothetical protein
MKEILRTDNSVKLSFAEAVLKEVRIECFILDQAMSSMYGGGLPFIHRRLMVDNDDEASALAALNAAFREAGDPDWREGR